MRPAADLGALGLRPMDGVACGQKSGKILVENLRKYFRGVFVVSALFSQSDCLSFWIAKRRERGERGENWLAARVGVGLAARALVLCHTESTEITEICSLREQGAASILYSTLITVNWTCNCSLILSSVLGDDCPRAVLRFG
jgi:hypothetical protein